MSYNWGFSTYGQRDKLKKIKNGDEALYNSEKALNKNFKTSYKDAGLSTADIDNWDSLIDSAWASGNVLRASSGVSVPKYSGKYTAVNKAFKEANNTITQERDKALKEAEEEEKLTMDVLSEWLANNGFSDKGYTAKTSKEELRKNYKELIDTIKKEYKSLREETRRSYFSPFLG